MDHFKVNSIFATFSLIMSFGCFSCSDTIEPTQTSLSDIYLSPTTSPTTQDVDEPYLFDDITKPETWTTFHSLKERQDACQIPDSLIKRLSTKALIETCLNYPLRCNYIFYNDENAGIEAIIDGFNGLQELQEREDASELLIDFYSKMTDVTSISAQDGKVILTTNPIDLGFIELLLSYPINDDIYSAENQSKLASAANQALEYKIAHSDVFGLRSIQRSQSVTDYSRVKKRTSYTPITILTHNGLSVQGLIFDEMTDYEIASYNDAATSTYSSATLVGPSSATYNCHSFAWNISDGGPVCWINAGDTQNDISNVSKFWLDGYYLSTIKENGNKVFYGADDHSAIAYGSDKYKSKWGQGPLMVHDLFDCPYTATNSDVSYYNTYFVQYNGQFDYDSQDTAFDIGESRTFTPRLYYSQGDLVYNWDVTTMKDEGQSVVGTKATLTLLNSGRSATISFSQAGMYMIILNITKNGQLHAEFTYEAIVEN